MNASGLIVRDAIEGGFTVTARRTDTYRIHIGEQLTTQLPGLLGELVQQLGSPGLLLLVDTGAAEHHLGAVTAAATGTGLPFQVMAIPAGESSKSPARLREVIRFLAQHGAARRTLLLGVGGGMVCDLVTAAAALYMRGVPYALLPTTVLAQVDAAVGGKGGVDLGLAKNLLGAFHQPAAVFIDPALTRTLSARQVRNGLAEVIKVALITDPALFTVLEDGAGRLPTVEQLTAITASAIAAKLRLLAPDPYEQGDLRRLLNLGHCIGHPYESATGYRVLHGEAVAAGTAAAAQHAYLTGRTTRSALQRILDLLTAYQLPTVIPEMLRDAVWDQMATVRRIRGGPLHLVVPHQPGHCTITDDIDRPSFDKALSDLAARP
ncbi:3-dehydroquinate synthase [Streptomyces luteireticuli]|uniref:3-dehydroquinate synthase family protein n=1 Tax=Streptomyces luteireticuli TaxID=173858 RepID=UPI0035561B19